MKSEFWNRLWNRWKKEESEPIEEEQKKPQLNTTDLIKSNSFDIVRIELGIGLLQTDIVKDMDNWTINLREMVVKEKGVVVPVMRIVDNILLNPYEYVIFIRGVERGRFTLEPEKLMVFYNSENPENLFDGIQVKEPTYEVPVTWVSPESLTEEDRKTHLVVDYNTVFLTHLKRVIDSHIHLLLSLDYVRSLITVDHYSDYDNTTYSLLWDKCVVKNNWTALYNLMYEILKNGDSIVDRNLIYTSFLCNNNDLIIEIEKMKKENEIKIFKE